MLNELNIREFVQRGIKKPLIFPITGTEGIKFRPLGDLEIHEAYNKPLNKIQDYATLKVFLSARTSGHVDLSDISIEDLDMNALVEAIDDVKAWIIYLATKDFQPEDYSIDDVKKLPKIFPFATVVCDISGQTEHASDIIKEFAESVAGRNLRHYLEQGKFLIADSFNDLTKTQLDFLHFTSAGYQEQKKREEKLNAVNGQTINFRNPEVAKKQFEVLWKSLQPDPPVPEV